MAAAILALLAPPWLAVAGVLLAGIAAGATGSDGTPVFPQGIEKAATAYAVALLVIGIVQVVVAILAWRGNGAARGIGVAYGVVFGLLALVVATTRVAGLPMGVASLAGWVLAIGYLYVALVFLFVWRVRR